MKLSLFLSASAAVLLAAAAPNEPSLSELLKTLTNSDGVEVLGRDGVLRNLNKARDTVVDYVQLSKDQVAEYTKLYMPESRGLYDDVDGRTVTSEAQLLAIPDFIEPYKPKAMTSKPEKVRSVLEKKQNECEELPCQDVSECKKFYCNTCKWVGQYCVQGGCFQQYRCRDPF